MRLKASGIYEIQIDPNATPAVHPPHRVPVALREPLKDELQRIENLGVIKNVRSPLPGYTVSWLQRRRITNSEYAWIPAISIVLSCANIFLCRPWKMSLVFSVLDANHGFWQVKLAKDSSKLATFNTPFGQYTCSYTRLPFGIASAPEVFQNVMSHLFQDAEGVS